MLSCSTESDCDTLENRDRCLTYSEEIKLNKTKSSIRGWKEASAADADTGADESRIVTFIRNPYSQGIENDEEDSKDLFTMETAMFQCEESSETIHYTLVCDFREDCDRGSDEKWCIHIYNGQGFRLVLRS